MSRSSDVVERLRRLEGGGLRTFVDRDPIVWDRAAGSWVWDADGRRYLDLYAGYAVAATGYGHPAVVEAIRTQAERMIHCPSAHPSAVRASFLEELGGFAPAPLDRILPAVTGAMANELAVAVARTRRPEGAVLTFDGSYFGRSPGVVGLAGKRRYREALGLPAAGRSVPFPYPFRHGAVATDVAIDALERVAAEEPAEPAAVIVEPIQGNGGVVIPPPDFFPRLRAFCDRVGAVLIVDEIQSGCGRTGRMWAIEHSGVSPDLLTVGKGIGGGMGVAAVLGRGELLSWRPDTYTSTFLTNAVNLAAATAALRVIRDERLVERAAALGPLLLERTAEVLFGAAGVGEVRGLGAWVGIELVDAEGQPDPDRARRAATLAREGGVLVGRGGYDEQVLKLSPPLVIEEDDLLAGVDVVAASIADAG